MAKDKVLMEFVKPNGEMGRVEVRKELVDAHKYVGWKIVKPKDSSGEKEAGSS